MVSKNSFKLAFFPEKSTVSSPVKSLLTSLKLLSSNSNFIKISSCYPSDRSDLFKVESGNKQPPFRLSNEHIQG